MQNKKILIGVCGSIAAYKTVFLTRLLVKAGAEVKVIMTDAATDFIQPLTFSTLSKNECLTSYTNSNGQLWNNHVELAAWSDLFLIAPATANTIAKMAHGICDNLLMGTYLSATCPVFIAPAMDLDMFHHPATQENLKKITHFGHYIIPVESGELASGLYGEGRMSEPEAIVQVLAAHFSCKETVLKGKKVVITAGPTKEHIDPVRFLSNNSSGKMGIALSEMAASHGALVTLILGPTDFKPTNPAVKVVCVTSAEEMYQEASQLFEELDIIIFSAAVADYTPVSRAEQKMKKLKNDFELKLKRTQDIADSFGKVKKENQISVGFALETQNGDEYAKAKLSSKNFDMIALNSLTDPGAGFRHDTNKIRIIHNNGVVQTFDLKSKKEVAQDIILAIENRLS